MNVHFFMDPFGHYSCKFTERILTIAADDNIIININQARITHPNINYYNDYNRELKTWLKSLKRVDRVYFHFYNPIFQEINSWFKRQFPAVISVWSFWGGDFYSLPEFAASKHLAFSQNALPKEWLGRSNLIRRISTEIYYRVRNKIPYNHKRFIRSFKKIDYLATYFEQDYKAVIEYSGANMKFVKFPYLSLDIILGEIGKSKTFSTGEKIMVGHSADPGLNHYEVIEKLDALACKHTVLLPLHYGNPLYKTKLLAALKSLKLKTEVIDDYMPLAQYNQQLLEVGYAVFNVNHQQAFGNIITLIWLGIKVFLHHESAIYSEFRRLGIYIFAVHEIETTQVFVPLTAQQKQHNREVLENILSPGIVNEMNKQLLELGPAV